MRTAGGVLRRNLQSPSPSSHSCTTRTTWKCAAHTSVRGRQTEPPKPIYLPRRLVVDIAARLLCFAVLATCCASLQRVSLPAVGRPVKCLACRISLLFSPYAESFLLTPETVVHVKSVPLTARVFVGGVVKVRILLHVGAIEREVAGGVHAREADRRSAVGTDPSSRSP